MLYMWMRYGKPDASMTGNGLLAGLVAITAPSGFVNPVGAVIIGLIAGVLVCLSVEFVEKVMKIDDPVGAISVHGTNGLWGVISVGLFADGKSNYGGSWGGVNGNVTGLFYGDAGQLVAQLIGVATLDRVRLYLQFCGQLDHRRCRGAAGWAQGGAGRSGSAGNGSALLSGIRSQGKFGWSVNVSRASTDPTAKLPALDRPITTFASSVARPSHGLAGANSRNISASWKSRAKSIPGPQICELVWAWPTP